MPIYEFTSPEGKKYRVSAPEGSTKEQAYTVLQKQLGNEKAKEGIGSAGIPHALETLGSSIYDAGGDVTDLASRAGASPEVAGGLGYGTNVLLQALTSGLGMSAGKQTAPLFQKTGRWIMSTALKPTYDQWKTGEARTAIQTLLDKGINATNGGVTKLKDAIGALDNQIEGALSSSNATVNKYDVASRLNDTVRRFTNQVNPQADLNTIQNAETSFLSHPSIPNQDIPVQVAQQLKKGTYKQLSGKYGELSSADTEAQKALARGLKEEIGAKVPQVEPLLSDQSNLIKALNVTERRALMDLNKNPGGLAYLANNPAAALGFMADKSALFKSIVARMLYSGANVIPGTAGALGGGVVGGVLANPPPALGMEPY